MALKKIKKGDQVTVIAGASKGHKGTVDRVVGNRVWVSGAKMAKKHVKPNPNAQEKGGVKEVECAVDISNVALVDSATGKAGRVSVKVLEDGTKVRCLGDGDVVDV